MTQMNTGEFFTTQKKQAYLETEAPGLTQDATLRHSKIMRTPPPPRLVQVLPLR